jgi:hypothetical protein
MLPAGVNPTATTQTSAPQMPTGASTQPAAQLPKAPQQGAKIDPQTVQLYLKQAGGNPQIARQLAAANGWTF